MRLQGHTGFADHTCMVSADRVLDPLVLLSQLDRNKKRKPTQDIQTEAFRSLQYTASPSRVGSNRRDPRNVGFKDPES